MESCCIFGPELQIDTLVGPAVRRSVLPRERFSRVPGMLNSSEVKVFHPT